MATVIAFLLLSVVLIVPTIMGLFLSGRGAGLRFAGAILVLPHLVVILWLARNLIFDINVGPGDGWTELMYFVMTLVLAVVGAIIAGIGRAQAGR